MSDNKENVAGVVSDVTMDTKGEDFENECLKKMKQAFTTPANMIKLEKMEEEQIQVLMREGKRFTVTRNYKDAIVPYSKCCEMIAEGRGETHPSLAEPAYQYGRCLFELARMQSGLFGSNVPTEKEEPDDDNADKDDPILGTIQEEPSTSKDQPSTSSSLPQENEEIAGGADDSELAYEWLDLARALFEKIGGKEADLRKADALTFLAEVKMEDEKLEEARTDYLECLEIQKQHLPQDDRDIASTYYQLGVTEDFLEMPHEAFNSYKEAQVRLVSNLDSAKTKFVTETDGATAGKLKRTIEDLEAIIPEVNEKIVEAQTSIRQRDEVKATLKELMAAQLPGFGGQSSGGSGLSSGSSLSFGSGSSSSVQPVKVNTLTAKRKAKSPDESVKRQKET